jgi:hypothetical protein
MAPEPHAHQGKDTIGIYDKETDTAPFQWDFGNCKDAGS